MPPRRFTLQPALNQKQRMEEMCQMELAEAEMEYVREHRQLEQLVQMEQGAYQDLDRQHQQSHLDLAMIGACFYELQALQRRIAEQVAVLRELSEKVQEKRENLLEVTKERKALEKLKEKYEREVAQALALAEAKAMQDIATAQYHRRKMAEEGIAV